MRGRLDEGDLVWFQVTVFKHHMEDHDDGQSQGLRVPVDSTGWTGTQAAFGFMLTYALISLGAPLFRRRINQPKPLVWVVGIIGLVSMIIVFYARGLP